jgi:O-methyltransferase
MIKESIKRLLNFSGLEIKRYNKQFDQYKNLYLKYESFTMVPEDSFVSNIELCSKFRDIKGDYVECGVWRGGMSAAISEILPMNKRIHLFDSFEGLPMAKEIDGEDAIKWQQNTSSPHYYNNCSAEEQYAIKAMEKANCTNYKTYKGWFNETVPKFLGDEISILRLDGDWYESIMVCLQYLFPKVVNGGIVILDDYHYWDGCAKAVHDYLAQSKSPSRIYQLNNQKIAYIIKKDN